MKLFLVLLMVAGVSNAVAGDYYDSMSLAIEHFNKDHSKKIVAWGSEHKFMSNALLKVAALYPAVAQIGKQGKMDDAFSSLVAVVSTYPQSSPSEVALSQKLSQFAADLTAGCGSEVTTTNHVIDLGFAKPASDTRSVYLFDLESRGSKKCANPVTRDLVSAGINEIMVSVSKSDFRETVDVRLKQTTNIYQDMDYVKGQLKLMQGLNQEFVSMIGVPVASGFIGRGQNVELVGSTGNAKMSDKFGLRYSKGWGDCPSGCIYHHGWNFEITPINEGADFSVVLVSEDGSPIGGKNQ